MGKIWCGWEEKEFDLGDDFELWQGGPLYKHVKHVSVVHFTNGVASGPGPEMDDIAQAGGVRDTTYGFGPMGEAESK